GIPCSTGQVCQGGVCRCVSGIVCNSACLSPDATRVCDCANACSSNQVCSSGVCMSACVEGQTQCGTTCVFLMGGDAFNCGGCGVTCVPGQLCSEGSCVAASMADAGEV